MPVVHCSRHCIHNRNSDDRCELPTDARIYIDCCCSGFRARPLPEPLPMIGDLVHDKAGRCWNHKTSRGRARR